MTVKLGDLQEFFSTSPAIRLLRARNAPFVIDFLFQVFKEQGRITILESELLVALRGYRETVQETDPMALSDRPEDYLNRWCHDDSRFLMRFYERGADVAQYQLTPHSDDVLQFLEKAMDKDRGHLATESRIRIVLKTLEDIVVHASDLPEKRLEYLRDRRERIDEEIRRIEESGRVERYEASRVQELFGFALRQLKELLGDFRSVEERFKEITREVQQRQLSGEAMRGEVLGAALDAETHLKEDDHGRSFYAFVDLILSPKQQSSLEEMIDGVSRLPELMSQHDHLRHLNRMMPILVDEARKILGTNQRLSTALRRLLDDDAMSDRRRIRDLLLEIKGLASQCASSSNEDAISLVVQGDADISSPFARLFWRATEKFEAVIPSDQQANPEDRTSAFELLAQMSRLNWQAMRRAVLSALEKEEMVPLKDFVVQNPPANGAVELLGYLQIARQDGHLVDPELEEEIRVEDGKESTRVFRVPRVVFRRSRLALEGTKTE